ncbi:coenzyme PQQ precursor peptide PqqA [Billgrantia desiderata SP1]|nr:coenzyme PQQ precursor peptide PqqA [Halomonas desiderata SP1]
MPLLDLGRKVAQPLAALLNGACPSIHPCGGVLMWTKPTYTDLRLGFEVTLYISNR